MIYVLRNVSGVDLLIGPYCALNCNTHMKTHSDSTAVVWHALEEAAVGVG